MLFKHSQSFLLVFNDVSPHFDFAFFRKYLLLKSGVVLLQFVVSFLEVACFFPPSVLLSDFSKHDPRIQVLVHKFFVFLALAKYFGLEHHVPPNRQLASSVVLESSKYGALHGRVLKLPEFRDQGLNNGAKPLDRSVLMLKLLNVKKLLTLLAVALSK